MNAEKQHEWVCTYTGTQFVPFDPDPMLITIQDIAHGLAGRFRFSGQSRMWYTVAQHSVEVSRRLPNNEALWGLLHDAAEAWLPDIQRPIKGEFYVDRFGGTEALVPFKAVEEAVLRAVADRFGLDFPMPDSVRVADDRELARERRDLFDRTQPAWKNLAEPYPETLYAAPPRNAEEMFLARFWELSQ